jgi:hypothetical protein
VSVNLKAGDTVTCTFTNALLPTLTIIKNAKGGNGTFGYTLSPLGSLPTPYSITTTGTPDGTGQFPAAGSGQVNFLAGLTPYTITESSLPQGWTKTGLTCTVGGVQIGAPTQTANGVPTVWGFTPNFGDNVVCTFDNTAPGTTRTPGFWATHTDLANFYWNKVIAAGVDNKLGDVEGSLTCNKYAITDSTSAGQNVMLGGFWSDISKTSAGADRAANDQHRMQLVQQYLAALLNHYAFGSSPSVSFASVRTTYCSADGNAITTMVGVLDQFNQSGDNLTFTPGSNATSQVSQTEADIPGWDNPLHPHQ